MNAQKLLNKLGRMINGGATELDRDDLLGRIVDGLDKLKHHGNKGQVLLPRAVRVEVDVAQGSVEVVQPMLAEAEFDRDIKARLLNQWHKLDRTRLPVLRYVVRSGEQNQVRLIPVEFKSVLLFRIEGGDRDGDELTPPLEREVLHLGRGAWSDADRVPNDLVVSNEDRFVSRRAARLYRAGPYFEVEALDQDDCLFVVSAGGARLRPARTVDQRLPLRPGDCLELNDGKESKVLLHLVEGSDDDE